MGSFLFVGQKMGLDVVEVLFEEESVTADLVKLHNAEAGILLVLEDRNTAPEAELLALFSLEDLLVLLLVGEFVFEVVLFVVQALLFKHALDFV